MGINLSETKICQDCKNEFVIEPDDFAFYEKMKVPAPTFCPDCRLRRRLSFRNERFMYKTKSSFSGKDIFSMYPNIADRIIYENDAWFSDSWDAMDFGVEYDFSKNFFDQLFDLSKKVPVFALSTTYGINSEYSNNFTGFKNCYLCFNGNYSEDSAYSSGNNHSKNCIDCSYLEKSENCYECFWITQCSNCFYSIQCHNSFNIYFCKNCIGCNDCFGCVNLRNKKYFIFNKAYSKEDYKKFISELDFGSRKFLVETKNKVKNFWLEHPVKYMEGMKNTNVSGEYIHNCKNVKDSFFAMDSENCRYLSYMEMSPIKDCYDYTVWGNGAELVYDSVSCGLGISNVKFCFEIWPNVRNAEYSAYCQSCSDIFGCVGIKNKKFCIFNKQYSESEYKEMREKIIKHMDDMPYADNKGNTYKYGEFFPPMFSPYAYNKTAGFEDFPMDKADALNSGYFWEDLEDKNYQTTAKASELPDNISSTNNNDLMKEIFLCSSWEENPEEALGKNCTKAFKFIPMELEFYRRFKIPLPIKCYCCRHYGRNKNKQPMKLWDRTCAKCGKEIKTSYAPDRPEIVYCESCYNQEVI